ncbi:UNVERIFIED_CONTAM: hypothetical protein K2H54_052423 [Gekko kuhli]
MDFFMVLKLLDFFSVPSPNSFFYKIHPGSGSYYWLALNTYFISATCSEMALIHIFNMNGEIQDSLFQRWAPHYHLQVLCKEKVQQRTPQQICERQRPLYPLHYDSHKF